jgi:protein phosphatase
MLAARYAARSDIGLSRQTNEDSWLARPPVFAVADGMGGARAGEVASRVALETLVTGVADLDPRDRHGAGELLLSAAEGANRRVWELSTEHASTAGMGTTLTALALCADAARLVHIGDSRAYALRDETLTQLTDDHSLVAEMVRSGELAPEETAAHPLRSVLSRALGTEPDPTFDLLDVDLLAGDTILLCSDGLTGRVEDDRIATLLAGADPEEIAQSLVAEALENGGPDNITVLVVRLEEFTPEEKPAVNGAAAAAVAAAGVLGTAAGTLEDTEADALDPSAAAPAGPQTATESVKLSEPPDPEGGDGGDESAGPHDEGDVVAPASSDEEASEASAAATAAGAASAAATAAEPEPPSAPATPPAGEGGAAAKAPPQKDAARPRRRWRGRLIAVAVAIVVVVGGVVAAGQLEWVGVADDGAVTVYRGVPWEFAGLRLYREHDRAPSVRYEDLTEPQQRQVDAHSVGWRGSGEELLGELRSAQ